MNRGYEPDFDIDLAYGEEGEQFVKDILSGRIEVKRDGIFPRTGNLYVEYECRGRDGIWRRSGIARDHNWWWHILGDTGVHIVVQTEKLREYCRPLLRQGKVREEKDGSNPTKGVIVNAAEFIARLSGPAWEGWQRRLQRGGSQAGCIACGDLTTRRWPVPESQQSQYGVTVLYCRACEPYEGEPVAA